MIVGSRKKIETAIAADQHPASNLMQEVQFALDVLDALKDAVDVGSVTGADTWQQFASDVTEARQSYDIARGLNR